MELTITSYMIILMTLILFSVLSWLYNSRRRAVLEFCLLFSTGVLVVILFLTYVPLEETPLVLGMSFFSGVIMLSFAFRYKSIIQGPLNRIKASTTRIAENGDLKNVGNIALHEEGELIGILRQYKESVNKFEEILEESNRIENKVSITSSELSDRVEMLNSEINEVTNYINKILQTSSVVAEEIDKTRSDTDELISRIEAQFDIMRETARASDRITDQTNLIAVNAAIEAANTDKQFQTNFSTVADGIQQLASRSRDNTDHLQSVIYELSRSMVKDLQSFRNVLDDLENHIIEIGENSNYASSNSYSQLGHTDVLNSYSKSLDAMIVDLKKLNSQFIIDK